MKAQHPRKRHRRRKCKHCGELYLPDSRHYHDQKYCPAPACRRASRQASHRRWYRSAKGAAHRDSEENKRRVREWRAAHPGYWRRTVARDKQPLQDAIKSQPKGHQEDAAGLNRHALQDMNFLQPALVVGLMAHLTGSALQDTIAETSLRFVRLGQDILHKTNPKGDRWDENREAYSECAASAPGAEHV